MNRLEIAKAVEPYLDPEGGRGLAIVEDSGIELLDWEDLPSEIRGGLVERGKRRLLNDEPGLFQKAFPQIVWPLPRKPEFPNGLDGVDRQLFADLKAYIQSHVWFQEPELYEPVVLWVMSTWTNELNPSAPRLLAIAPTDCGKTRLLKVLGLLAHRPFVAVDTSRAAIYRSIRKYNLTLLLDEFHDIPRDSRGPLYAIIKAGFEPDSFVPRCDKDNGFDVDFLPVFGPMAIASKKAPPLDIQNRAITIHMKKHFGNSIERIVDKETATDLRTRLLAFRLQVLAGKVKPRTSEAMTLGLKGPSDDPDSSGRAWKPLGDRSLQIATTLFQSGLHWTGCAESLMALAKDEESAQDELRESKEGIVFYGLQGVVNSHLNPGIDGEIPKLSDLRGRFTVQTVSDQIFNDLLREGQKVDEKNFRFKPTTVGRTLKDMGIGFKRCNKGSTLADKKFEDKYENLQEKFGARVEE